MLRKFRRFHGAIANIAAFIEADGARAGTAGTSDPERNPRLFEDAVMPSKKGAHIDQRLAGWILMAHDRTRDKTLPLTHEFPALMLGVRRPGVTEALQSLKRQKLIETGRNQIGPQPHRHREDGGKFLRRARKGILQTHWLTLPPGLFLFAPLQCCGAPS
jgi:CRP-like cAMP-binding protein